MIRVLLSAYQCAPGQGSVSQIGWEWYSRLVREAKVTLVTHIRNRPALEDAGAPLPNSEIIYIDTEWFAGKLYGLARWIFPRSEHSVFLLSSLDFFVYDRQVLRAVRGRRAEWDVAHVVTPVSPSAFTVLTRLPIPVVRGPLNGGLQTPAGFPEFMRADSAWVYKVRELGRPLRALFAPRRAPDVTFTANAATEGQLTRREQASTRRLQEIAADPNLFEPAPWPQDPDAVHPLRLLFVGRLIPAKALPLLFEAIRRVRGARPVELTVAGDGPMRETWQKAASDLTDCVRFLGAIPARQVASEMRRAHVLCLPCVRESGGAVLFEAMSSGRPVIAVDHGGPAGIVTPETGALAPAASPDSVIQGIETALLDIFANPDTWRRKGSNARSHVVKSHTWESRVEAGLQVYRSLVKSKAGQKAA